MLFISVNPPKEYFKLLTLIPLALAFFLLGHHDSAAALLGAGLYLAWQIWRAPFAPEREF
jgi:hypothetical protein